MAKIDQTIERLLADTAPAKPVTRPAASFGLWVLVTFVSTACLVCFSAVRPDMAAQLASPLFLSEIATLFLLIISTALVAIWLCYPDLLQKRWVIYLPLLPLALFVVETIYRGLHPELSVVLPQDIDNGINCVSCIAMYALVPGFWMFYTLQRHATVYPRLAGAISLLAASSIGLLILKFVEGNDPISHLLVWHITPVILLGCLGGFLGKKYLSW